MSDFEYEFQLATMNRHLIRRRRDDVPHAVGASHVHLVELGTRDRRVRRRRQRVRSPARRRAVEAEAREALMSISRSWRCAAYSCAAAAALALGTVAAQPTAPVRASEQLVVSANPHASEAGRRILRAGGGAVDAAIAVQLVLTLVEPQSSGIGGGAFMLVYAAPGRGAEGKVTAYEGRETAPAAATPDMFLGANGRPRVVRQRRQSAVSQSACRARCACSSSRIASTAACRGPTCSRRRSSSPRAASRYRRVCSAC